MHADPQTLLSLAGPLLQAEMEEGVEEEAESEGEGEGDDETKPLLLRTAAVKVAQELHASWLDTVQVCREASQHIDS